MTIYFDMDGTICDLYKVANWLEKLRAEDTLPYEIAKPLLRLSSLARILNNLQRKGYRLGVISWTAKNGSPEYNEKVKRAKEKWLKIHMKSVHWDEINIVPYGTPKQNFAKMKFDVLFDDEKRNRESWTGISFDVQNIIEDLKGLIQSLHTGKGRF